MALCTGISSLDVQLPPVQIHRSGLVDEYTAGDGLGAERREGARVV